MNELDLIKEVEKRPILYNKFVKGFNKTKLRDHAWANVQEALNSNGSTFATVVECKKRWRSLRDSYTKLQRTHGVNTRWPYAKAMKFLRSHVIETKEEGCMVENRPESQINPRYAATAVLNLSSRSLCLPPRKRKRCNEESAAGTDSDHEEEKPRSIQCQPDLTFIAENNDEDSPQPSPIGQHTNFSGLEISSCQCNRNDPDEQFLLSCAPILKRLNSKQNAIARMKIQQALLESEFGSKAATDQPRPANDTQGKASLPCLL